MGSPVTMPGDQVSSDSFIVKFVGAQEREDEDNWHRMMVILLNSFDTWPRDMARIEKEAEFLLQVDIRVKRVRISDTYSRIKRVYVHLVDVIAELSSMLIFDVTKKQGLKTLQTLAAERISDSVLRKKDFEHLELPKQLLSDLNEAYDDIWRPNIKYYKCYKCKHCNEDTGVRGYKRKRRSIIILKQIEASPLCLRYTSTFQ